MSDAQNAPTSRSSIRRGTKLARVLSAFAQGRRLNRFDAEQLGDHVLNTTVSMLEKRGVRISRKLIEIEGRFGSFHCCEYWIDDTDIAVARSLLPVESP